MKEINKTSQELLGTIESFKENVIKEEKIRKEEEEKKRIANLPENIAKRIFQEKIFRNRNNFEIIVSNMLADLLNSLQSQSYNRNFSIEKRFYLGVDQITEETRDFLIKLVLNEIRNTISVELLNILDINTDIKGEWESSDDDDFGWSSKGVVYLYLSIKITIDFNKLI